MECSAFPAIFQVMVVTPVVRSLSFSIKPLMFHRLHAMIFFDSCTCSLTAFRFVQLRIVQPSPNLTDHLMYRFTLAAKRHIHIQIYSSAAER